MLKMGPIKFLYNSKFDFTAKSLVTNTVVKTRVLCRKECSIIILIWLSLRGYPIISMTSAKIYQSLTGIMCSVAIIFYNLYASLEIFHSLYRRNIITPRNRIFLFYKMLNVGNFLPLTEHLAVQDVI